jgi:RimJ/RimL family protein N-acetyltransferase
MSEHARYVELLPMPVRPVTLIGNRVNLVPMTVGHVDALFAAANFPEIWAHTTTQPMATVADIKVYVETALAEQLEGRTLPFVTTDPQTGEVIGSTRYADINVVDRNLAIGWSWLRPDRQRTGVNGEAKALMLQHAFDSWGALRVEIRTDVHNTRSRAAIERIGGTYEGTLRQNMIVGDGRVRSTAYYSIIDVDWRNPNHRAYANALSYGITPRPTSAI